MKQTNSFQSPLILIIDDEEAILKTLKDALTDEKYRVETLSHGKTALDIIGRLLPDLILLDIFMPNCNGLDLLAAIKKEYPHQKVMMISGFGTISIAIQAIQRGATDFIEKPLNLDEILNKLEFLKREYSRETELSSSVDNSALTSAKIIGESNLFLELIGQAERLAPHIFPIIIYGEAGVGKSTVAHFIHTKSSQAGEFITINCETLSETSFSNLYKNLTNKNQTVFLQHIDLLCATEQRNLLEFMEQTPISEHARIIASSRMSLFDAVQKNLFSASLFYRLNRGPIELPALRKRPCDIPLLINHFLNHANKETGKNTTLAAQALRTLCNYEWPGNVTELQTIIHVAVAQAKNNDSIISPHDLVSLLGETKTQFLEHQLFTRFDSIEQATSEFEKNFLLYLFKKNNYNITQLASRLNIEPLELRKKIIKHKIDVATNFVLEGVSHE